MIWGYNRTIMKINSDFRKIIKRDHENKWVAFNKSQTKIIDYSESLLTLEKKVGKREVIYFKVPSSKTVYAF